MNPDPNRNPNPNRNNHVNVSILFDCRYSAGASCSKAG